MTTTTDNRTIAGGGKRTLHEGGRYLCRDGSKTTIKGPVPADHPTALDVYSTDSHLYKWESDMMGGVVTVLYTNEGWYLTGGTRSGEDCVEELDAEPVADAPRFLESELDAMDDLPEAPPGQALIDLYAQVRRFPFMVRSLHGHAPEGIIPIPENICLIITSAATTKTGELAFLTHTYGGKGLGLNPLWPKWELVPFDPVDNHRRNAEVKSKLSGLQSRIDKVSESLAGELDDGMRALTQEEIDELVDGGDDILETHGAGDDGTGR